MLHERSKFRNPGGRLAEPRLLASNFQLEHRFFSRIVARSLPVGQHFSRGTRAAKSVYWSGGAATNPFGRAPIQSQDFSGSNATFSFRYAF